MEMGYIKLALINMYDNTLQILIYTYAYYVLSSSIFAVSPRPLMPFAGLSDLRDEHVDALKNIVKYHKMQTSRRIWQTYYNMYGIKYIFHF